jgi:hypothetical protein
MLIATLGAGATNAELTYNVRARIRVITYLIIMIGMIGLPRYATLQATDGRT